MGPVEIWLAHESFDQENFRIAGFHVAEGRVVVLHEHCHTPTCQAPPPNGRPHRHAPCTGSRHWRCEGPARAEFRPGDGAWLR